MIKRYEDGTVINTLPNGTEIKRLPDGTMIKTLPDGRIYKKSAQQGAGNPGSSTSAGALRAPRKKKGGKKRKSGYKKPFPLVPVLVIALCAAAAVFFLIQGFSVYKSVHVAAGVETSAGDFCRFKFKNAKFAEDSGSYENNTPGVYRLKIKNGLFTHSCTLYIEDFDAPQITMKDVTAGLGADLKPEDFVAEVVDGTACTVSYDGEEPKVTVPGTEQTVKIKVVDAGGNVARGEAKLSLMPIMDTVYMEIGGELPTAYDFTLVGTNPHIKDEASAEDEGDGSEEEAEDTESEDTESEEPEGEPVPVQSDASSGQILTDLSTLDLTQPGTHEVRISFEGKEYPAKLCVVDTVPPKFYVKNIEGALNTEYEAKDFVINAEDASMVMYTFEHTPDFSSTERQIVVIVGTDGGGNQTRRFASLKLTPDTEQPVFSGEDRVEVNLGSTIAYRQLVTVKDNSGKCELDVDSSQVNPTKEGEYPVTYTATDGSGNTATKTITLCIVQRSADEQELDERVDAILAEIINDDMTQEEKAWEIYAYLQSHMNYVDSSEKGDYVASALQALDQQQGDCYTYFSITKVMLTRAGIKNMDIERIPEGDDMHYWNLVDIEDGHGWYHYDTTPRWDHPTVFLWTDAQAQEYSVVNQNCYNYDRDKYPEIP